MTLRELYTIWLQKGLQLINAEDLLSRLLIQGIITSDEVDLVKHQITGTDKNMVNEVWQLFINIFRQNSDNNANILLQMSQENPAAKNTDSLVFLLEELDRTRNDTREELERLKNESRAIREELNRTRNELRANNIVPPGFIYIQLPGQPEPKTLWPMMTWEDISSQYAGLFFRVLGGNAKGFGIEQDDNAPRIVEVSCPSVPPLEFKHEIKLEPNGELSDKIFSGSYTGTVSYVHQFRVSDGEVRPLNKAVRIWKRTN